MGLIIGSIFPRGDSYPQTQQPSGPGTPVVAPLQPAATPSGQISVPPFPIYVGPPIEKMTRFFAGCNHGFMEWEIRFGSTTLFGGVPYGKGKYGVGPYSGGSGGIVGPAAFLLCPLCGYVQNIYFPASLIYQQEFILG